MVLDACHLAVRAERDALVADVDVGAAAQREVWTGADLRRLMKDRAGVELSAASVSALMTGQPSQVKLSTLAALCTALDCSANDLFEIDTTPVTPAPH